MKLKNIIPALFLSKQWGDRLWKLEKNILVSNFIPTRPGQENSKKKKAKKFKKLKNIIPALFLSKPEWDRPRKRKKKFVPNSVPTRPGFENSKKKKKKNSRN